MGFRYFKTIPTILARVTEWVIVYSQTDRGSAVVILHTQFQSVRKIPNYISNNNNNKLLTSKMKYQCINSLKKVSKHN